MTGTLLQIPLSRGAKVNQQITFRLFQEGDAEAFRELNEWGIARYFKVEEQDLIQLNDPGGNMLQSGGQIGVAMSDGERIGCCALVFVKTGVFEVAKMAVSESYRSQG